jgi:hypothetical protein
VVVALSSLPFWQTPEMNVTKNNGQHFRWPLVFR